MQDRTQVVGPINSAERIPYIDILRGVSLFAILAGNMRGFNAPSIVYGNIKVLFASRGDIIAQAFVDTLLTTKFVTIFSFLFGVGFAVQMTRAESRGAKFMSYYPRRLAALALFGLIHGILIWWGDILLAYAVAGTILVFFRNRRQRTLLWWAAGIFSLPIVAITASYVLLPHQTGAYLPDLSKINAVITIYAHGSVSQILKENLAVWTRGLSGLAFSFYTSFLFLLGMWTWRTGLFHRLDQEQPMLKRVCVWCFAIGVPLNVFVTLVYLHRGPGSPLFFAANLLQYASAHVLAAGYAAGLAVLIHNPEWLKRLTPFAAVGRMALTNYLMQSAFFTAFFYSYATGFYGRVGPAMDLLPTVIFFAMQVWFSNWWLARYRFGPIEWLWRGIEYWKFPPLRKRRDPGARSVSATA